jgi:hypothetical protein
MLVTLRLSAGTQVQWTGNHRYRAGKKYRRRSARSLSSPPEGRAYLDIALVPLM